MNEVPAHKTPERTMKDVDADWQYLWSQFGVQKFCEQFWNQYVAVCNGEVIGSGATDAEARAVGSACLAARGQTIPSESFCVDFVGEDIRITCEDHEESVIPK